MILWAPLPLAAKTVWTSWLVVILAVRRRADAAGAEPRSATVALTAAAALYICAMVLSNALASRAVRSAAERAGIAPVDALARIPEAL